MHRVRRGHALLLSGGPLQRGKRGRLSQDDDPGGKPGDGDGGQDDLLNGRGLDRKDGRMRRNDSIMGTKKYDYTVCAFSKKETFLKKKIGLALLESLDQEISMYKRLSIWLKMSFNFGIAKAWE